MSRMIVKKIVLSLLILVTTSYYAIANASPQDAQKFIESISKDALQVINSKLDTAKKEDELTSLFTKSVNTKWMARFVMGKYWNEATEIQRNKYIESHRKFLIKSYIPKFKEYNNQTIKINKAYADGDEYMVQTSIIPLNGTAINIDYKVRKNETDQYMIYDIVAEGVSLITTMRADFSSVLAREGVDILVAKLDAKN